MGWTLEMGTGSQIRFHSLLFAEHDHIEGQLSPAAR